MKKQWMTPKLEVLDVNKTMGFWPCGTWPWSEAPWCEGGGSVDPEDEDLLGS